MGFRQSLLVVQWTYTWIIFFRGNGVIGDVQEYCQTEQFHASCQPDHIIVMSTATFGRMSAGRCISKDLGHLGCSSDALSVLDRLCSGRPSCRFEVYKLVDSVSSVCHRELARYLEASYTCLPVTTTLDTECDSVSTSNFSPLEGYISNSLAMGTDRGSRHCPWIIRAQPGQRINVTLINFARVPPLDESGKNVPGGNVVGSKLCYNMATIEESGYSRTITGCEGEVRTKVVHVGTTSVLKVSIEADISSDTYFLLRYIVSGCPSLTAPAGGWVNQADGTAVFGCTGDDHNTWQATCDGNQWVGVDLNRNCTAVKDDILIVVAIGVALGVFLGGLLLTCVHHRIKRSHETNEAGTGMYVSQTTTRKLPKEDYRLSCPYVTDNAQLPPGGVRACDTAAVVRTTTDMKYFEGDFNDYCRNMRPVFLASKCSAHTYESPQFERKSPGSE